MLSRWLRYSEIFSFDRGSCPIKLSGQLPSTCAHGRDNAGSEELAIASAASQIVVSDVRAGRSKRTPMLVPSDSGMQERHQSLGVIAYARSVTAMTSCAAPWGRPHQVHTCQRTDCVDRAVTVGVEPS